MEVTRIGMDIAKQLFDLHGVDGADEVTLRRTTFCSCVIVLNLLLAETRRP
jgi:hypothetical protein